MEGKYFENRKFKLWFYHITHGEAIVRSLKSNNCEKNIDIYFGGVEYIEFPTTSLDLRLEKANEEDISYLTKKVGKTISFQNVTVFVSGSNRYYIVASINRIIENTLEMLEIPIATFVKGVME